jgi:hypothetical protein
VRNKDKVLALRDMTFDDAVEGSKKIAATPNSTTSPSPTGILTPQLSEVSNASILSRRSSSLSEKARGKLPMTAESQTFHPTQEWVFIT